MLRVTVANELQYDKLLELHEELDKKFHHLTYKYVLIGEIFESFSEKFLIYCEVLSKLKYIEKLIEQKMAFNKTFREDILRLEKDFNKKKRNDDKLLGKILIYQLTIKSVSLGKTESPCFKKSKVELKLGISKKKN